jgi:hypothetical protein
LKTLGGGGETRYSHYYIVYVYMIIYMYIYTPEYVLLHITLSFPVSSFPYVFFHIQGLPSGGFVAP